MTKLSRNTGSSGKQSQMGSGEEQSTLRACESIDRSRTEHFGMLGPLESADVTYSAIRFE